MVSIDPYFNNKKDLRETSKNNFWFFQEEDLLWKIIINSLGIYSIVHQNKVLVKERIIEMTSKKISIENLWHQNKIFHAFNSRIISRYYDHLLWCLEFVFLIQINKKGQSEGGRKYLFDSSNWIVIFHLIKFLFWVKYKPQTWIVLQFHLADFFLF